MIAVITLPGPDAEMHGLDRTAPLALLPLGDRPMLQHIVEFLVLQGVRQFEFLLEHAPQAVEQALGDGTRWGCRFRYHLTAKTEQPYRSISVIQEIAYGTPWLLAQASDFPLAVFHDHERVDCPVWFSHSEGSPHSAGTILFPGGDWGSAVEPLSTDHLSTFLSYPATRSFVTNIPARLWLSAHSPTELLATQERLLSGELSGLMMGGVENDPGVWIARNVAVHPSAKLIAPVFVGPNSRIGRGVVVGPNVVVSGNCVIDEHSTLRNSLLVAGSYVGEKLELDEVIVDRNLLVSAKLGTGVTVSDNFLLGGLAAQPESRRVVQWLHSVTAFFLILVLSPFYLLAILVMVIARGRLKQTAVLKLPAGDDSSRWRVSQIWYILRPVDERFPPAGWASFLFRFLPGLFAVASGKLRLVGLPPRSIQEAQALTPDWQVLYLNGTAGLITEASVVGTDAANEIEVYLAEACYRATQSWWSDVKLFFRYFAKLLTPSVSEPERLTDVSH